MTFVPRAALLLNSGQFVTYTPDHIRDRHLRQYIPLSHSLRGPVHDLRQVPNTREGQPGGLRPPGRRATDQANHACNASDGGYSMETLSQDIRSEHIQYMPPPAPAEDVRPTSPSNA